MIKLIVSVVAVCLLVSCSTGINDYQSTSPKFDLQAYFTGKITARGMLQDYSNKVTRRFCVDIHGSWQGNRGLLKEIFYFDDGEISHRNWHITKMKNGHYSGRADDVVGTAMGSEKGFAFHWNYVLSVPVNGSNYHISMDDWMYRLDEYRLFNKTTMKKFGISVGEVTLFFDKAQPLRNCP